MAELTQEERELLAKRGFADPHFFCKFFLSEWFPLPMPWVHRGLLAVLTRRCEFLLQFDEHYGIEQLKKIIRHFTWREDPANPDSPEHSIFELSQTEDGSLKISMVLGKNTLVMMPRGSSKTTIANAANIWDIVYHNCPFGVYISETGSHAAQQLTNVAHQLTSNPLILAVFGDLRPEQRSGMRWSESEGFIQTSTGVTFVAKGRGAQVRGLNVDGRRPKKVNMDDVEDKESVKTEEQRKKTKEWFVGDVMPALSEMDKDATIVALGTLLHADALLVMLMQDPEWTVINIGVVDKDGEALWPEWMTLDKIERKKRSYAMKGMLHIFYLEYFNTIRSPEDAKFTPEMMIVEPVPLARVPHRAIVLDPAISKNKRADFSFIIVVGMRDDGRIQVLDDWYKKGASPRELIDEFFRLKVKWDTDMQGVEAIQYQAALIHLMQEEMFRKGKEYGAKAYFEIEPIRHFGNEDKDSRILGIIQPRFAAKYIRFQRVFPMLTTMLLDWPNGKKDGPDALAMAISLLDPFAGVVADEGQLEKSEYPPLEEVFGGDWRSY